jgi:hypothetical protein
MKLAFIATLALASSLSHASELTFSCTGSSLLGNLRTIEWTERGITLLGSRNGMTYAQTAAFDRAYPGNGFAYAAPSATVLIPFDLINGKEKSARVEIFNSESPDGGVNCSLAQP